MTRTALILAFLLLVPACAFAQDPRTGFPPYGSFNSAGFDTVNHQNLNVNFAIPIVASPGRSVDLRLAAVYDSLIWKRKTTSPQAWVPVADQSGTPTWGWTRQSPIGSILFTTRTISFPCAGTISYSGYSYLDPSGTRHAFTASGTTDCNFNSNGTASYATDGSGYYMDPMGSGDPAFPVLYSPSGITVITDVLRLTDTNGNLISPTQVGSSETDWKDTLGRTALKISNGASSTQYQFLDVNGAYQTVTMNLQSTNVKTNFGCSGISEYTGTANLPVSIALPNGQSYSLTYEDTPTFSGYKTGRLKRITLPTGGYYEYQYPASPNNGINCADGTVLSLTRVVNDGTTSSTWTFVRSQPDSSTWKTVVTPPTLPYDSASNQSSFTFNTSGQETSEKFYQGSEAGGSLLRTVNLAWAANGTPASRTIVLENNQQSETETDFDTYGNLLALREYDLGSGAPGVLVRTTTFSYASGLGPQILNRLASKKLYQGSSTSGVLTAQTDIGYDETLLSSCPTAASQHDDVGHGCSFTMRGNPTSTTTYLLPGTTTITKNVKYDVFGNSTSGDLNCCGSGTFSFSATTQYSYPDSVIAATLTTTFAYNAYTGQTTTSTNPNNKTTTYTYDPKTKRPLTMQRPDGSQVQYSYDDTQRIVTVQQPIQGTNAAVAKTYSDGLGRAVKTTVSDTSGTTYSIVETQYDPLGRAYKVSNPHNSTAQYWTETRYDGLGRPTVVIPPGGSATANSTQYSYSGSTVTVTDPAGKQKKSQSDGLGRLATVYEPDVNAGNALTQQTSYVYNVLDALTTVTQGLQTRTYNYDAMGRLTSSATPEAGTATSQYNNSSHVTQRTDARGVITTYSYDTSSNWLTGISYNVGTTGVPLTPSVTLSYGSNATQNNNGRLFSMTDGIGSETYSYDSRGRVTQVAKTINGTTYNTSYAYNSAGELTSITYPSGRVAQPNYDAIGRLCAVGASGATCTTGTNYVSGFGYNTAQQVTGFNYGNGVVASLGYSPDRLQLTSLSHTKNPATLLSLAYGYSQGGGNNGQITSITDNTGTQEAGRSVTYAYDALYRLSSAVTTGSTTYPKWGLSWSFDRYGNRLNQTQTYGMTPTNFLSFANPGGAQTNRPDNMCFDANGNLLAETAPPCPSPTYVYDAENRLVNYSSAAYSYDGNGLRVKKVSGGTTTVYIFSRGKVIAEYDNGAAVGSPSREYIYSGGAVVAKIEGGVTTYFHPDRLSNRLLTDSSGNLIGQRGHYPFGETWYETGTTTKLKFTTYERDSESTNDFAMARYNVNRFGRFSSVDAASGSAGSPQSLNRYAYVANDPVNLADHSGNRPGKIGPEGFGLFGDTADPVNFNIGPNHGSPENWRLLQLFWTGSVILQRAVSRDSSNKLCHSRSRKRA